MKIEGKGKLLKIYIGESDQYHNRPLYQAIVERLKKEGMAGATVSRGLIGYGANSRIHSARILRLSEDLPVVIEVVDTPERIDAIIPVLDEMVKEGLVMMVTDVEILKYSPKERKK